MQRQEGLESFGLILCGLGDLLRQFLEHSFLYRLRVATNKFQVTQITESGGAGLQQGQNVIIQLSTQMLQSDGVQRVRRQSSHLQSQKPLLQTWMLEDGAKWRKKDLNTEGAILESVVLKIVELNL